MHKLNSNSRQIHVKTLALYDLINRLDKNGLEYHIAPSPPTDRHSDSQFDSAVQELEQNVRDQVPGIDYDDIDFEQLLVWIWE